MFVVYKKIHDSHSGSGLLHAGGLTSYLVWIPPTYSGLCVQIDSNTDGLVDFSEFVAATVHVHQLEEHDSEKWQKRSKVAFEKFDVDKDGFITPDELKTVS